jgi:putative zinc finger/helix-turn-helix YgiT family protein
MSIKLRPSITMYCDACGDDRKFLRERRRQDVLVRGETIPVNAPILVCESCGATQPDLADGVDSLAIAYDEYRRRHDMLPPQRIRQIREKHGLSREAFAAILGMSAATLYRYEGGALQDELHDSMIYACDDPATIERLVNRRRDRISDLQYQRFKEALSKPAA